MGYPVGQNANLQFNKLDVLASNPLPVELRYRTSSYLVPLAVGAWSGYTNQPDGDDVEILSNSASDVQKITVFYTKKSDGTFAHATKTLTGTDAVSLTGGTDVDDVLGMILGEVDGTGIVPAVGTITLREASGNLAITTITAGVWSKGLIALDFGDKDIKYKVVSGNLWKSTVGIITTSTGYSCTSERDEHVDGHLFLISDGSGAVVTIDVLED